MKTALVTGVAGQDGSYMAELLLSKGYHVIGTTKEGEGVADNFTSALKKNVELIEWDMLNQMVIADIFSCYKPAEVYNYAALHSPAAVAFDDSIDIGEVNGLAVARILKAINEVDNKIRFCQASSSEMFGDAVESPQSANTPFKPRNPYGAAKLYAHSMIRVYRQRYGLFACSAILFNHESPRRGLNFVTRKVTQEAARIKLGLADELCLGNLDARRDWGFAGDYVRAMWLMLQQQRADDYIVATGETHSVRELCEIAFKHLDLDYRDYVKEDASAYRPAEQVELMGDPKSTKKQLGWMPEIKFEEMVKMMVDADMDRLKDKNSACPKKQSNAKRVTKCRICGNTHLVQVLDLGEQMLTGICPRKKGEKITTGPLRLVKCMGGDEACGLLQLEHSYDLEEMYGANYGYRSGLNASMVAHLHDSIKKITKQVKLRKGDLIIDIGSNDSTTLQAYPSMGLTLVGIDPTASKFCNYYPSHIQLIADFFSSAIVNKSFPGKKAKIVTSFSMFYDLEDPIEFMRQVYDVLADDGVWVFEQSYMPAMLKMNSYDTVCHEHLEFYALHQIKWMTDRVGFKIVDIELNDANGGSFSVTVAKAHENYVLPQSVQNILHDELLKKLNTLEPYKAFAKNTARSKADLLSFIKDAQARHKTVAALGASTKGNVLLQYCGITEKDISAVGEVNIEKFGCFTPGTWIPIISEDELLARKPDYLIVLPWHFRKFFLENKKFSKSTLVFPLPELEVMETVKRL